jgi:hypothetical protein
MPFQATLTVEGKSFNILECSHSLTQKYERGRPTSGVRGGVIVMLLDGSDEDLLGDWATGTTTHKDGEITFERVDQQSSLQKLEFQEAYTTMYFEFMGSTTIDATKIYYAIRDSIATDAVGNDEFVTTIKSNRRRLLRLVERMQVSSCILLRLSAAKIKLDGIEHKNT